MRRSLSVVVRCGLLLFVVCCNVVFLYFFVVAVGCWLFAIRCVLFVGVGCLLCAVIIGCSLIVDRCLLFVVHCLCIA